jgi:hypothetical protein
MNQGKLANSEAIKSLSSRYKVIFEPFRELIANMPITWQQSGIVLVLIDSRDAA